MLCELEESRGNLKNRKGVECRRRQPGDGRTQGEKINSCRIGVNIAEPRKTHIQLNAEPEAKPVFMVVWRGGEAIRQKE
jgi:hypothetical protein